MLSLPAAQSGPLGSASGKLAPSIACHAPESFAQIYAQQALVHLNLGGLPALLNDRPTRWKSAARPHLDAAWERLTGVAAEKSAFTLVMPVHNEARLLPSVLRVLNRATIGPSVNMQLVIVTNACKDGSASVARNLLKHVQDMGVSIDRQLADSGADDKVLRAYVGNVRIVLIDTKTAGKANALNIGNGLALRAAHPICMCLDADAFVEPNSVALLFAEAHRRFSSPEAQDYVAVSSRIRVCAPRNPGQVSRLRQRLFSFREHEHVPVEGAISGCLWAWKPVWMQSLGGCTRTVAEDLALACIAKAEGKRVALSDAKVWVFDVGTLSDYALRVRRHCQGMLQVRELLGSKTEAIESMVGSSRWLLGGLGGRIANILLPQLKERSPTKWPGTLASFLLHEYWWYLGRRDHAQNPHACTWQPCQSTK